ncbi:MAG TPA: heat-shock protein Hsp20 [Bacteroidales bacterium]|nr:heat-shock protein Hsp20 [Bacteroidales bacterium]
MIYRVKTLPNLMNEFFGNGIINNEYNSQLGYSLPAVNITENEQGFKLEFAAPGYAKNAFSVKLDKNILIISAQMPEKQAEKYFRREFNYTNFERKFEMPSTANFEEVAANYENGVLTVSIPKKEEAKAKEPRMIEIA